MDGQKKILQWKPLVQWYPHIFIQRFDWQNQEWKMGGEQLHRERREIHFKNHILPRSPHQDPSLTIQFSLRGGVNA